MVSAGETWAAWVAAGGACCGDSGGSAFGGDGSLELGDGAEDVEDESSAGCGGVNGLCGERSSMPRSWRSLAMVSRWG